MQRQDTTNYQKIKENLDRLADEAQADKAAYECGLLSLNELNARQDRRIIELANIQSWLNLSH